MENKFYKLQPLGQNLGAEVLNFEFSSQYHSSHDSTNQKNGKNPNSPSFSSEFISQIKKDVADHRLLIFREQKTPISGQLQVDFSELLGEVTSIFGKHPKSPHPDIFRVSNDENEGCTNVGRAGWHIDGTFMMTPFKYQTMYFPSVCEGGSTEFVGLKELYDSVSREKQDFWDRLWWMAERRDAQGVPSKCGVSDAPVHPLVYQHPDRFHEKTMCFHGGGQFVDGWLLETSENSGKSTYFIDQNGLPTENVETVYQKHKNDQIQNQLTKSIENMEFGSSKLRIDWKKGDFSINDNLAMAHYATPGTQNSAEKAGLRVLHRTTVVGENCLPKKADGRTSFQQ